MLNTYIRLTSFDNDDGMPVVIDSLFVTNLVGDYDRNMEINGDDLLEFTNAWYSQNVTKEIGPAIGEPPDLSVLKDSVIDFEDLMVFGMMWRWYTVYGDTLMGQRGNVKLIDLPVSKTVFNENYIWQGIKLVADGNGTCAVMCNESLNFIDLYIDIEGLDSNFSIHGSDYWMRNGDGIVLTRTYKNGTIELTAAYLGDIEQNDTGHWQKIAWINYQNNEDIENITVMYKARSISNNDIRQGLATISSEELQQVPKEFTLEQNKPNPFNPSTTIEYSLPFETGVKLSVYNITGQQVALLKNCRENEGNYIVLWDAANMPSGIYFYILEAGETVIKKKMLLLK
ncbi:hypothetical protein ES708_29878 [subsurface metagenome]